VIDSVRPYFGMIHVLPCVALRGICQLTSGGVRGRQSVIGRDEEEQSKGSATALRAGTRNFPKRSKRPICRRENAPMSLGHPLARLRTTQFLEQENKRLIRSPGRMPKAHLTGSVRRNVGIGRASIQNGFDLAGRRDDEFGM
jgi:hypothetical protein